MTLSITKYKNSISHSKIYLWGILLFAASLPLSPYVVSISQFVLAFNWLFEGEFKKKAATIIKRRSVLIFLSLFIIHIIWLIPTTDFHYALKDLKIKLPLLVIPLIIGSSRKLSSKELRLIIKIFTLALFISTIFSIYKLFLLNTGNSIDIREISIFISHIRFSLLINISIFSLLYILYNDSENFSKPAKQIWWIILIWMVLFLFILQSATGIIVLLITGSLLIIKHIFGSKKTPPIPIIVIIVIISLITLLITGYTLKTILSFNRTYPPEMYMKDITSEGNIFSHYTENLKLENGNYVWINICEPELEREWNQASNINYKGKDLKNQDLRHTLFRYMTSKGLDKSAEGFLQLSRTDISNIENGLANYIYINNKWLYPRIYQIIWEIDYYLQGGNSSGHSVAQRIEYWKTGISIIKENWLFGVGTGDVAVAFEEQYSKNDTGLTPEWQLRAHNLYITFAISFGIPGLVLCLITIISPFVIEKRYNYFPAVAFLTIALLSFLVEDTIETQAGASFFAFFYTLFILAAEKRDLPFFKVGNKKPFINNNM